jgi:hypothetical protein
LRPHFSRICDATILGFLPFVSPDRDIVAKRGVFFIQTAIENLSGKLSDVPRTRILLTRIEDWEQVAAIHGEFFRRIRPANTSYR